ncbi:hypothetical protein EVAR_52729_1 [Eumeta japonica]|uniref:Uncharacterized protein n=1 Tax=Eumeta variegata TaxID=151549 RepID=A0A4C1Y577_EUMVA|nr:hypothetical protein EVAR_52729_1 [Eumeta japonica]
MRHAAPAGGVTHASRSSEQTARSLVTQSSARYLRVHVIRVTNGKHSGIRDRLERHQIRVLSQLRRSGLRL